jgi:hypothetical protein
MGVTRNHAQGACRLHFTFTCNPSLYQLPRCQETRAAQAPSRPDPDATGDESFGWYTSEAVGVVVSLWMLLLGLVMYDSPTISAKRRI